MRAARIEDGNLRIQDVDVPVPAEDEALVRITAAGVCHSDLHLVRGDWYGVQPPVVGHEAIGIVEALGPGAERFVAAGDRVIPGLGGSGGGYWCGACEYCLRGQPRHCAQGKGVMGVFAEQFAVYAPGLVKLPDNVRDHEAPLACGGLTAYGAVKKLRKHGVEPGRTVAVGAAGGLGHHAVQLATAFGYRVVGDMRELVDLAAAGTVKTHVSRTGALSELHTIFDELEAGSYLGRAVVTDLAH